MTGAALGTSWWGRAWIDAIEAGGAQSGSGIRSGRTLARRGAVHELQLRPGHIAARVIGRGGELHDVDIAVRRLAAAEWAQVAEAIARRSGHLAALLDGELSPGVVDDAAEVDVALLVRASDLRPDCSCDEWEEPCRHAAAACYVVAGELDRNPFALFRLRGIERTELIAAVRDARAESGDAAVDDQRDPGEAVDMTVGPAGGTQGTAPSTADADRGAASGTPGDGPGPTGSLPRPHPADGPVDGSAAWLGRALDDELLAPPVEERSGAPDRLGQPGPLPHWDAEPPARHGVDPGRVDELARDAIQRAWGMLVDDRPSGLRAPARADLARRVAADPDRLVELASLAGVTTGRLKDWARAWAITGDDAVTVVADPRSWSEDQHRLEAARDDLVALGLPRRSIALNYDSLRTGPRTWLVLGPRNRWYRLSGTGKHQDLELDGAPADAVTELVDPPD